MKLSGVLMRKWGKDVVMFDLEPWSFCGEIFRLDWVYVADFAGGGCAVRCPTCNTTGNIHTTGVDAVIVWNTRVKKVTEDRKGSVSIYRDTLIL